MRKSILFPGIVLFACCFASCVDSKYDLSDVDTDDVVIGGTWVAPLGSGSVETDDLINVWKVPSIKIESDGRYVARYEGELKVVQENKFRAGGTMKEVATGEVDCEDLSKLFDGDFVLDLVDPHIQLNTNLKKGTVDARLDLISLNATKQEKTSAAFPISDAKPNVWIGSVASAATPGYLFVQNNDINKLIQIVPDKIRMSFLVDEEQAALLPEGSFNHIGYTVEAPLTPAAGFRGVSTERISDAFDESFVSYLFKGGSATIFGDVVNEMPFDLSIEMTILDEDDQPIDISFPLQPVKGKEGKVEFKITEKDMPKMEYARHISLKLYLSGREQAETLKKGEKVTLNLKIKKEGGISL